MRVSPGKIWGTPRGAWGAGKAFLHGVTGFSGTEDSRASQALGCRPQPWGAGWVQAVLSPCSCPSVPPQCQQWHLTVPWCSLSTSRDSGCPQQPPQNRPLSSSSAELCFVNDSAARSRCLSVLIRRARRWGTGKKNMERKEKEQPRAPKQLRCQRQRFNECACGSPEQMSMS